jgi:glyoxylase-like metal-dependent hydrolase (beta-lactamase superfamily II)
MDPVHRATSDVYVLPTTLPIPGVGALVVNAYLILAAQPVLVDTGLAVDADEFEYALRSIIDPADIRWVWLTHDDADHTGNLERVMSLAPAARLATHGLGALRMATWWPVPLDRVCALRPGDRVDVGDRCLRGLRPPVYDNPMSTGLLDERTGALFTVDAFGAILPTVPPDCADVPEADLVGGMATWAAFDAPWTHLVDRDRFRAAAGEVARLRPSAIFSSHLPAASGQSIDQFVKVIESAPTGEPFIAPDQEAFDAIVAGLGATTA